MTPETMPDRTFAFLRERLVGCLTTLRPDGTPHLVGVGFAYDPRERVARVIARADSVKVRNARRGGPAALFQVSGGRWVSLECTVRVAADAASVQRAVQAYAERYGAPGDDPARVALELTVTRVLGTG